MIQKDRKCLNCNQFFPFKWFKTYCSESCRVKARNSKESIKNRYRLKHPLLPVVCPVCKKTFTPKIKKKYCSKKCMLDQQRHERKIKNDFKEIGQYIGGVKKIGS